MGRNALAPREAQRSTRSHRCGRDLGTGIQTRANFQSVREPRLCLRATLGMMHRQVRSDRKGPTRLWAAPECGVITLLECRRSKVLIVPQSRRMAGGPRVSGFRLAGCFPKFHEAQKAAAHRRYDSDAGRFCWTGSVRVVVRREE